MTEFNPEFLDFDKKVRIFFKTKCNENIRY